MGVAATDGSMRKSVETVLLFLTEVLWSHALNITIELGSMSFLQTCAKAKVG